VLFTLSPYSTSSPAARHPFSILDTSATARGMTCTGRPSMPSPVRAQHGQRHARHADPRRRQLRLGDCDKEPAPPTTPPSPAPRRSAGAAPRPVTARLRISWGYPSSSLHHDLGRVHRVKAKPLRGRFATPDTAAKAKGDGSYENDGEDQDAAKKYGPSSNSSSNASALSRTAAH